MGRVLSRAVGMWGHISYVAPVAVPVVFVEVAVYLLLFVTTHEFVGMADSTADVLAALAAGDGLDPYVGIGEIGRRYGVEYVSPASSLVGDIAWIHPRLPGAFVVMLPLSYLGAEGAFAAVNLLSLLCLAYLAVRLFPRASGWSWTRCLLLAGVFAFSAPFVRALQFGAWSVVFAVVLWEFWRRIEERDDVISAVALGMIGAVKIYPLLGLAPAILARRWRSVSAALVAFAATNLVGVLGLGVGVGAAAEALRGAGSTWMGLPSNGSLTAWLARLVPTDAVIIAVVVSLVGLLGIWIVWRRNSDLAMASALTAILMLLATPLSWASNDVILLFPVAVALARAPVWRVRVVIGAWFVASFWPAYEIAASGTISLVGRLGLAALLVSLASTASRGNEMVQEVPGAERRRPVGQVALPSGSGH